VAVRQRWFVYVLRCADGSLYTGIARDLARRVAEHNAGRGAKYTRGRRPVAVVHREVRMSRGAALRREHEIKRLSRAGKKALPNHGARSAKPWARMRC
jgi:putative endonuclease